MIQMMYLVYTAMLALNVAAEVLNGFVTVGDAMNKSNDNIELKLQDSYSMFQNAYQNNPDKTQEYWNKAQEVQKLSTSIKDYLDSLQYEFLCTIQSAAEIKTHDEEGNVHSRKIKLQGPNKELLVDSARVAIREGGLSVIEKKDDNHSGSAYFFGASDKATGKSVELKERIIDFKRRLKTLLGEDSSALQMALNVEQSMWSEHAKAMVPWEQMNFDNTIVIADMVVLSRLKAEAMNAEFDAVNHLYSMVSAGDFKFDQVTTISRPISTYIIEGGKYETRINIGAYDSKAKITANINGQTLTSDDMGTINYSVLCTSPGEKKIKGVVYVKKDSGTEEYPIEDSYFVAEPVAVAELTKMNVVYMGVDNPISVSVPGVDSRNVIPSIPGGGGTIAKATSGGAGDYVIRANKLGRIKIQVDAKTDGKTSRTMGTKEIRVKQIPKPIIQVGNFKDGESVNKAEFLTDPTIRLRLEDFDFQLPTPLRVNSFSFNVSQSGQSDIQGTGNRLTPDMVSRIKNARRGQKIYIDDVTVKMPDGRTESIRATFRIKG